jgi:hypothetical protein
MQNKNLLTAIFVSCLVIFDSIFITTTSDMKLNRFFDF